MLNPDPQIVREIKCYDPKLSVKWSHESRCFEVWRQMPWGDRLITPIVESIYSDRGESNQFCPLDHRIMKWLYKADGQRNKLERNWRWLDRKRFMDNERKKKKATYMKFEHIAADNYNLLNREFVHPIGNETDFLRPDVQGRANSKVMYRSAKNAKKYFEGRENDSIRGY